MQLIKHPDVLLRRLEDGSGELGDPSALCCGRLDLGGRRLDLGDDIRLGLGLRLRLGRLLALWCLAALPLTIWQAHGHKLAQIVVLIAVFGAETAARTLPRGLGVVAHVDVFTLRRRMSPQKKWDSKRAASRSVGFRTILAFPLRKVRRKRTLLD